MCTNILSMNFNSTYPGGIEQVYGNNPNKETSSDSLWRANIDVMQFTGILDKHRKEIYAGDVIVCQGGYDYPEGTTGCECAREVIFEEGQWLAFCKNCKASDPLYEFDEDGVIGNIYENPELLTKENE